MNLIFETAEEAIDHSLHYGEITYCVNTTQNRSDLLVESDGDCDTNKGHEYWGNDDRPVEQWGIAWRVIIKETDK